MKKFLDKNAETEYYKLKAEHHENNWHYFGTMATAHVVKGIIHDIMFKYYSMRESLSFRKYMRFRDKQWKTERES